MVLIAVQSSCDYGGGAFKKNRRVLMNNGGGLILSGITRTLITTLHSTPAILKQ